MSRLDLSAPDYAADHLGDPLDDAPPTEVVRWYERRGWPIGGLSPITALAGAFALGVLLTAGIGFAAAKRKDAQAD